METNLPRAPVKVMFVLPDLSAGGAERVMIRLMNSLDRMRFAPSMLVVMKKNTLRPLLDKDIPCEVMGKGSLIAGLPAMYKSIHSSSPDIIISTMAPLNFTLLLLRPMFPETKFLVREAIVPTYILNRYTSLRPLLRLAYKYLYRMADVVISPSKQIQRELSTIGLRHPHQALLYNSVDENDIHDTAPENTLPSGDIQFVASGRLTRQKGFDRLLHALKSFSPSFTWSLTILGEGEERQNLTELIARYGLQKNIVMPGHVPSPWPYYKAADIFLLPSRSEGMPNVALESLACGTPVIAMKEAGGIGEIAQEATENTVLLADTMDEFIRLMAQSSELRRIEKKSLLPEKFKKAQIVIEFDNLLSNI